MGALLAFEVVRELERRGGDILALIVSGCPAPHLRATRTNPAPRTDAELVDQLRSWGGTPAELLDDPEFMALALRPLRADLALCDRYRSRPGGGPGSADRARRIRRPGCHAARRRGVGGLLGPLARRPCGRRRALLRPRAGRAVVDIVAAALSCG